MGTFEEQKNCSHLEVVLRHDHEDHLVDHRTSDLDMILGRDQIRGQDRDHDLDLDLDQLPDPGQ